MLYFPHLERARTNVVLRQHPWKVPPSLLTGRRVAIGPPSSLKPCYQCFHSCRALRELMCALLAMMFVRYVVQSGLRRLSGVGGMRFIIQSERSAEYVEERVLKFIHESERIIREMDEETFQNNIDALSTILLEKPKTTTAQARSYWGEITSGNYRFERNIKNAAILRTVTKEDVLSLYAAKIALNGPERKQLSVWVQPGPDAPAPPEKAKDESEEGGVVADDTADAADTGSGDGGGGGADGGDDAGAAVAAAKVEELLVNRPPVVEVADVLNFQYGLSLFPVPTPDEHTLVE